MSSLLLILVIILSGFVFKFKKEDRFLILKAVSIVILQTVIVSIFFVLFMFLVSNTFLNNYLLPDLNSFFGLIILIAITDGVILYWINRLLFRKKPISNKIYTIIEYIIQWSLIYITVYQVIFDNLTTDGLDKLKLESLNITNPADLILFILPSLISVWIAVIMEKLKKEYI